MTNGPGAKVSIAMLWGTHALKKPIQIGLQTMLMWLQHLGQVTNLDKGIDTHDCQVWLGLGIVDEV